MRYRGIRAEHDREKNKAKIYNIIKDNPDILFSRLVDLAKPIAKDTVTKCVRDLVREGMETVELLKKGMMVPDLKNRYVVELKAGNRKIYRIFGLPLSALTNQGYLLSQHHTMEFCINYMETQDYTDSPLKDRIEYARFWVINPICHILWDMVTNDIENSTKNRFSKEILQCRERIRRVFDIVKSDPDADKILPYVRAAMRRESLRFRKKDLNRLDFSNLVRLKDSF